jgi:thermitase
MALLGRFFALFRHNTSIFIVLFMMLLGVFKLSGYSYLKNSLYKPNVSSLPATNTTDNDYPELLVALNNVNQLPALQQILQKLGTQAIPTFQNVASPDLTDIDNYFTVDIPNDRVADIATIQTTLQQLSYVDDVEQNEKITLEPIQPTPITDTPHPPYQLNDPNLAQLWGFDAMNIQKLYETLGNTTQKPTKKARIFILDTGIDAQHEDIKNNYLSFKTEYDNDPQGHGTHCAGIAAAVSNNQKGIASFSPDNTLLQVTAIKVLNANGIGTQEKIVGGIIAAADAGADVISMSLGGPSSDNKQKVYKRAVKYAADKGAIVVVAAGNENTNATRISPANAEGVIAVAALDEKLQKATFSNTVNDLKMAVAAPGVSIFSTLPNNKYAPLSGTSMATPYIAGLLGILKAYNPNLTTSQAYQILNNSGIPTQSTTTTGRLVQPHAALQMLLQQ